MIFHKHPPFSKENNLNIDAFFAPHAADAALGGGGTSFLLNGLAPLPFASDNED